ncbi:tRNA (adenosine(37)-N6)-dimethylallyltransferase MiaA [Pirellulales bacterium]|nr:tRNA (adenosine(37)-N6)-dimethylallyltransferase MiaA [Pirellulales bacterium]
MPADFSAHRCWYLTGATAVGKTGVGLDLARRLNAEIVSLDSMAVYRGMDVGTAKPTPAQQAFTPHHLIDVVDPWEDFSLARYVDAAHQTIAEIRGRGREPLFVGGTPLYLKALLRGIFAGPGANWELREQIEEEVAEVGSQALHDRLEQIDPVAASMIHPNDTRRLIRAVEVYRATGEPISHQQLQFDDQRPADACRVFVLRRPREEQHNRINSRVDDMIARGLVDEVERIASGPHGFGRTASQAVGYREVLAHAAGKYDHETMVEKIKTRTRRFAKRQGTWFRSLSEARFVDIETNDDAGSISDRIASLGETVVE